MINTALTQFASSTTPAEDAGGIAALGLDLEAFIVQLITFVIVFYILKKYVFGYIVNILDKRQKVIEQGVQSAKDMTAQKEELDVEVAKLKSVARGAADEILTQSHSQAEEIITKAGQTAEAKADKMLVDAKKKIEEETEQARRGLKSEIVALVVGTTEKLIGAKVDVEKDKAIIDQALKSSQGKQ